MDVVRSLRDLPLPMPADIAQTFRLLGLFDPREGIEKLLSRVDIDRVRPRDVYNAVLRRPPDNLAIATPNQEYNARRHLKAALEAPEFQRSAMRNFLQIYSDKRRDVFIHIPKCAGTDLVLNLAPGRLSFPKVLTLGDWVTSEELLSSLSGLVQAAPFYSEIFIYGHMQVGEYYDVAGVRGTDRLFTVIRDPVELLLSQANYAAGRLRQDPSGEYPDTRQIIGHLGIDELSGPFTPEYSKSLAAQCLLNRRISQPNRICYYLGKEQVSTYQRAMEHIVTFDIEVTETSRYPQWLEERWGLQASSRHNESERLVTSQEARRFFSEQIQAATSEDQKLFDVINWVLKQTGSSSTRGREIVEIAGPDLLTTLPERLANERQGKGASVLAIQGSRSIEVLDTPFPPDMTAKKMLVVSEYSFGKATSGDEIAGVGWAVPEANFTWSNAGEATIDVPAPKVPGDYILRVRCSPYAVADLNRTQRVSLAVNGKEIGAVRLRDISVLDYDLPAALIGNHEKIRLTFQFPDAIQPSELGRGSDERLLAIALSSISLLRLTSDAPGEGQDRTPPDLPTLALAFESLGENCEFGLVQRRFGAEPLGLLRFSSTPLPKLMDALRAKFKGLGDPANIEVQESSNGREYMVRDKRFGFLYHAWVLIGEQKPEEVAVRETRRLPLLIRKLTEDLALGEKIFVFHGMNPLTKEEAGELAALLHEYGPSTLLWVELADANHAPGTVERIAPGLLKGYMDRFAPGENAHDLSIECWTELCRNAYRFWRPLN